MNELGREQHHLNAFQGSCVPKLNDFNNFLVDIRTYASDNKRVPIQIFFSYAWPRENLDGEGWHTPFIRGLAIHLEYAGLTIHVDQLHSGPGHELNAFMQKIQEADRVFVFGSKTRDYKLSLPISGVGYENNLIVGCKVEKSINHPFIIQVCLSKECRNEPDSKSLKNAPVCTDYLMLLKWLIAEAYSCDQSFEIYWQERLILHKILDNLWHVPAQAPNIVRRSGLFREIDQVLTKNIMLICCGAGGFGKTQLILNYVWENYYRYSAVYWLDINCQVEKEIKTGSLVIIDNLSNFKKNESILARTDIKIIVITKDLQPSFSNIPVVNVDALLPEEAKELVFKILGDKKSIGFEKLIEITRVADKLSSACGYIQRCNIKVAEYLELFQNSPENISDLGLMPIREPQSIGSLTLIESNKIDQKLQRPRLSQYDDTKLVVRPQTKPQIADPLPDNEEKEKLRFEEQQQFLQKAGHLKLLEDVSKYALKQKINLSKKIVYISFVSPPDNRHKEHWTEVFVNSFASNLRQIGITVSFKQANFVDFIKEHSLQIDNVHVFIIGSRCRDTSEQIKIEDEQILRCLGTYPQLNKPDRRFIVPIMLTSEKHFSKAYDPYAAHSFYDHGYAKSLCNFLPFICGFNEHFQNYWVKKSLKHKVESNWWPQRLPENQDFVGRQGLLDEMQKYFWRNSNLLVLSACYGIGGVGKTQLALKFAHQYGYKYSEIFWFNGESKNALIECYIQLGIDKGIFDSKDIYGTMEDRARFVINWILNILPEGWLLIIDNALNFEEIKDWIPAKGGKILITSRHTEWPGQHNIPVNLFTLEEAREYICKILTEEAVARDSQAADELIKLLEHLPLAIAQACAYIKHSGISIAKYRDLYKEKHEALLEEYSLPSDHYRKSVAVTWNITLEKMKKESPASVELLYCCTHLYNDQIPENIVKYFFEDADETILTIKSNAAKRVAKEYSMIIADEQKQTFSMHSLVQQTIRDQLIEKKKDFDYLSNGIKALTNIYPYGKDRMEDYALKRVLKSHLEVLLKHVDKFITGMVLSEKAKQSLQKGSLLIILISLGDVYGDLGDAKERRVVTERALKILEVHYGKEHIDVATALINLATAYGDLGDAKEKKVLLERALKIQESHYGKEHIGVATALNNLANTYGTLGDAKKKRALLERALKIKEEHYGREHVEVAMTLNNLAAAYGVLGDAKEHKAFLERALKIQEAHYGNEHAAVAKSLVNLATAHGALGNAKEQKALLERALKIEELHYGKEHVEVSETLVNLAISYGALGNANEQKALLERALKIQEAHYGEEHVEIATVLNNLAIAYGALGDAEKKRALLERALNIIVAYFGEEHVNITMILNNLANAYGVLGAAKEKREMLERALKIREAHYGKEHVEVAMTLHDLANAYGELDDAKEKKIMLERALKIKEAHYGKEHIEVARTLNDLATAYGALDDAREQKALLERALIIKEAYYGKEHVEVAITLNNLANAYGNFGNIQEKRVMLERALIIKEAYYGKEHSETATTMFNLGVACCEQKNLFEARSFIQKAYLIFITSPNCGFNHPYTKMAKEVLDEIFLKLLTLHNEDSFSVNLFKGIFSKPTSTPISIQIDKVVKKYKLPDASKSSLEKGLRNAATNNNADDLKCFIDAGCNINAQDAGVHRRTALHWAVIKQAIPCIKILLQHGAQYDIADEGKRTAIQYSVDTNNMEIINLFPKARPVL